MSTAVALPPSAAAQNVWNKIKQQGQKNQQQQPPQKPGQPAKPGQAQNPPQASANSPARNDTGPFSLPAGTKVEPTLLASQQQGAQFSVSPHGVHMATQSHTGSRPVMIYDGVPGPKSRE